MFNSFDILVWLKFLSIINFFTVFFIMVVIVKKFFTFVNNYFHMKKDTKIQKMLGRQVKRFLKQYVKGAYKNDKFQSSMIAQKMMTYYGEKVTKQNINSGLKSPQWSMIWWLEDKYNLNIDWLLHGEEDQTIQMLKL